jgi:predicted RNA-binding protein Jag
MESFEFQGKNIEDAIENACRELNIPKDAMGIEVIEPGSAGIFGLMGGRKTKIRVTINKDDNEKQILNNTTIYTWSFAIICRICMDSTDNRIMQS